MDTRQGQDNHGEAQPADLVQANRHQIRHGMGRAEPGRVLGAARFQLGPGARSQAQQYQQQSQAGGDAQGWIGLEEARHDAH